jgi:tetratricopeptide (TPR) repeat protein
MALATAETLSISTFTAQPARAEPHSKAARVSSGLLETRTIDVKKSLAKLTEEIKHNPNAAMGYMKRARQYCMLGQFDNAVNDYTKAIKLNQGSFFAYQMRGYCRAKAGDYRGGIADFTKAIAQNPNDGAAFHNRAAAYDKIGRPDLARLDRDALKKLHFSSDSLQQTNYARYLVRNGEYRAALKIYDRKIQENPENSFAYLGRAQCYYKLNEGKKALAEIAHLEKLRKTSFPATRLKAMILLDNEKFDQCIEACAKELSVRPNNAELLTLTAKAHKAKGDFLKAEADYTRAIKLEPANSDLYLSRGQVYEKLGKLDKALCDYDKLVSLNKGDPSSLPTRAMLLRRMNQDERAIADLTEAIKLRPQDEYLYSKRAEIYYSKQQLSNALRDYSRARSLDPANAQYYASNCRKIKAELEQSAKH